MRTDADIAQLERILDFTERGCARTEPFGGERHRYTLDHLLDRLREEAGIEADAAEFRAAMAFAVAGESEWTNANGSRALVAHEDGWCWQSRVGLA